MKTEIWKDIPGYEGRYQASDLGRIKSLKRQVRSRNWYTGADFYRTVPERILRPGRYCKSGHLSVVLGRGTSGQPVHQLVMRAFVGDPPDGYEVLHSDGDPSNNILENLRYGTRTENILDVYRQGGRWRKLSVENVGQIREMAANGVKKTVIAEKFGIAYTYVFAVINGRKCYWWI
jgi:hypothetical protein